MSKDKHLISVDELRAAGALDVPPAWRKSLGGERELSLFPDDNTMPDERPAAQRDADGDAAEGAGCPGS